MVLTDLSVNFVLTGETRASVTPGKIIQRNKIKIKSLTSSTPRKDVMITEDKMTLGLQKISNTSTTRNSISSWI